MANTKISALPTWSGTARDLRWFVMNNSGETETFKFSGYSSQFILSSPGNQSYKTPVSNTNGKNGAIAIGSGATISSSTAVDGDIAIGLNAVTTGAAGGISIGFNTSAGGAASKGIAIGQTVTASGRGFAIGTNTTSNGDGSVAFGLSNTASQETSVAIGGDLTASALMSIAIGRLGTSTAFGSINIGGYNQATAEGCVIIGKAGDYSNPTTNSGQFSSIIGGKTNKITSAPYSSIVGGIGNTITGGTLISMFGTSGRTGTASATTYVENLHTFRTPSTDVQPISSGTTFTCNLDNGAKSQFYITGTSTINITNVRDGASFMIKTQTDGNYNITWTATGGYTFVFEGGLKDPGNNVTDIFVFEVFGSVIYGNRRHNYS